MAKKLSVSIPDDIADELRVAVPGNVSAFVSAAVRDALDRGRLARFVAELEDELGPADEDEVAEVSAMFARITAQQRGRTSRDSGTDG